MARTSPEQLATMQQNMQKPGGSFQIDPSTGYQVWVPDSPQSTTTRGATGNTNPFASTFQNAGQAITGALGAAMPPPTSVGPKTGYYNPSPLASSQMGTSGNAPASQLGSIDRNGVAAAAFGPRSQGPIQNPGNNMTNPGYDEQAFLYSQNRFLNDPAQGQLQDQYNNLQNPTQGEDFMNQNLGTLMGPGQGDQYWNQVQGQYMNPMAGEQFARQATQNFAAQGPASAFYNNAMGQYDQFTGYSGPQNTQGQYNQSAQSLAGGTQGEQGLGQLAGQYGSIGQYQGGNQAMGQYQQNAASGPLAAQQFYDQVAGSYGSMGQYSDPNLAAGQYAQTQQAFGDLPIANFDPFFDRAIQLGTQDYNRQAAGRGVYGSSEALNGVGNIVTDLNAQRALKGFDAEMQRAQEQRARQELLGNQARMGDLSSLAAFGANLSGLETYGNLANNAGQQTLGQQTMLGNQARAADQTALDAFNSNLRGVDTFANVNNMQGNLELSRNELLGNMANQADSQALGAQEANIAGLNAFGNIASNADSAEARRYESTTNAMNQADRTALDRLNSGADVAFRGDENKRANYDSSMRTAEAASRLGMDRTKTSADIANTMSNNDLQRLQGFMGAAGQAEGSRQGRMNSTIDAISGYSQQVQNAIGSALQGVINGNQADWEAEWEAKLLPEMQRAGMDQKQIDQVYELFKGVAEAKAKGK
jgi:hypothetical protein